MRLSTEDLARIIYIIANVNVDGKHVPDDVVDELLMSEFGTGAEDIAELGRAYKIAGARVQKEADALRELALLGA